MQLSAEVFQVVCCIVHHLNPTRHSFLNSMYSGNAAPLNNAFECHHHSNVGVMVELLQDSFRLLVLHFDRCYGRLDLLQQYCVLHVCRLPGIVFMCAIVLDLFTRILHFGHAQRRGGTLQKVPKGGESHQFLFSPSRELAAARICFMKHDIAGMAGCRR